MPYALPAPDGAYPISMPDGSPITGTVLLKPLITHPNFEVGNYSYASDFDPPEDWAGRLAPYLFPFSKERLVIGRFCQIAHGVRFITASANHLMAGVSTYPFPVFDGTATEDYQPDRRDTVIGHDVWLGHGAMVLPGARIGNGAIIGAGAVVRGEVPDYAVVAGNPGQVVKMRFPADQIARLLELAWWHWPEANIIAARAALEHGDVAALEGFAP